MEKIIGIEHRLYSSVYGGNTQKELDSRLLLPLPSPNSTTVIGYTDLPAGRSVGVGFQQLYSL
jgi:hypothetical protein